MLFLVEGTASMKGSVISNVTKDAVYLFPIIHYVLIIDLKITKMSLKQVIKGWTLKTWNLLKCLAWPQKMSCQVQLKVIVGVL